MTAEAAPKFLDRRLPQLLEVQGNETGLGFPLMGLVGIEAASTSGGISASGSGRWAARSSGRTTGVEATSPQRRGGHSPGRYEVLLKDGTAT